MRRSEKREFFFIQFKQIASRVEVDLTHLKQIVLREEVIKILLYQEL